MDSGPQQLAKLTNAIALVALVWIRPCTANEFTIVGLWKHKQFYVMTSQKSQWDIILQYWMNEV